MAELDQLDIAAKSILDNCGELKFLAFRGEMGVGKTTLIQAIGARLGTSDNISSPTFSLVNEYVIQSSDEQLIYHFDFYRIENLEEVYDIGYEEYFYSDHYCLVEWPEKIEGLLPPSYAELRISRVEGDEESREITIFKHQ
ncbi:MAG: tRNA (adenosine(37)-N6)-threonylcarbamoyltransferase complex ATPase subunit type 1 TsaE [Flavobacteriales bacterium]|nr:tRNA (adenosine(37)-N6)-threonylcarbamoyltransferase complex ATPase subunit type 1 TsaE [Flavobacteriales bacterium]